METQSSSGALDPRIKWLQDHNLSIILRVFEPHDNLWNVTDVLNLQRADCNELLGDVQGLIVFNRIQAAKNNSNNNNHNHNHRHSGSFHPVVQPSPKLDSFHSSPLQQHHQLQQQQLSPALSIHHLSDNNISPPLSCSSSCSSSSLSASSSCSSSSSPSSSVSSPSSSFHVPFSSSSFSGLVSALPSLSSERVASGDMQAALMAAVEGNDVVDVASILSTFPNLVNREGEDGQTALFCAKSTQMLHLLIERGGDVNHRSKDGDTPIYLYADTEHVSILHRAGADINARNMLGETPLGNALEVKDMDLVHTLLSLRANPELIAKQPLEFAAQHCSEAVPALLKALEALSCASPHPRSPPRSPPHHLLNHPSFANGGDKSTWRPEPERVRVLSDTDYPALGTLPPPPFAKKKGGGEEEPWIEVKRERQPQPPGGPIQPPPPSRDLRSNALVAVCPFNSGHRMAPSSLQRHKFTCSDRPKSRGGNGGEHGQVVGEMVTCSFNQGHCVPRATLSVHERRCPDNPQATLVQCPHTSDHRHRFAAEDMPAHAEKCRARPVVCPYDPRHKMPFQALQKHKEICPARPM